MNDLTVRVLGFFLFVGLILAALLLGQAARRSFPKSYATVDRVFRSIELLYSVLILSLLLYFCIK
jgi:hypothetical protein